MNELQTPADPWQLTDNGPESYERFQVPSIFEPLAQRFLCRVELRPGDRVLDAACGTGIVARRAAARVSSAGRVVGVDLNSGMLDIAKRHSGAQIEWRKGDACALPCEVERFDVVLCQQGLQFLPDKALALQEMHRVLVPGGLLGLCVWRSIEHSPCNRILVDILDRYIGKKESAKLGAPFAFGAPNVLHDLVAQAGFLDIEITTATIDRRMRPPRESIPGHLASTPVGPRVAALDAASRASLIDEAADALAEYVTADGMNIPQGTHIVTARKAPAAN